MVAAALATIGQGARTDLAPIGTGLTVPQVAALATIEHDGVRSNAPIGTLRHQLSQLGQLTVPQAAHRDRSRDGKPSQAPLKTS